MGRWGRALSHLRAHQLRPSLPFVPFPSRVKFPCNATENALQVVVCCCKTLRQGLGAAEPSDGGPAAPFLDERKRGGSAIVGEVSNVSLSRSEARPQIRFTGQICKYNKITYSNRGIFTALTLQIHLALLYWHVFLYFKTETIITLHRLIIQCNWRTDVNHCSDPFSLNFFFSEKAL